ncbi:hypothetical protein LDY78_02580, partial [Escherichia coli]|nr:hypothetical protein [Escherichia coli]
SSDLARFGTGNSGFDGGFARINLFFWFRISLLLFQFARKLEQQQTNAEPEEQVDPRKAAVAAAIARAQAKKAAQQKVVNED